MILHPLSDPKFMTTKYQRQWTEFEAIKSIYEKEFEEIKFPWKVDHPPWFKINLPAGFFLEVKMTKVYPDGIPEIKVSSKVVNLKEQCSELESKLIKEATGLVGSEMCFDLIEIAREHCDRLAKRGKESFHAEMLKTKEEKDKEAMDIQAIRMQKDEEMMMKQRKVEMEELEKKIRDELKDKLVLDSQLNTFNVHNSHNINNLSYVAFDPPILVDDGQLVKSVSVLQNTPRSTRIKVKSDEGRAFDLKIIPLTHPFLQTFGGRRQLENLLKQLKNHPIKRNENVVRCFGGSIDKEQERMVLLYECDGDISDESVLEHVSLKHILEQAGGFSVPWTVEYLKQICNGLIHLHASGITHRSLDLSSVHLYPGRRLKIEDYLVRKCLMDLAREHGIEFEGIDTGELKLSWEAPEMISRPNLHGKKVDIWSLGRLAIQMIFGPNISDSYASYKEFRDSASFKKLPDNLKEFLGACFNEDSAKRLTAEELLTFNLFKEGNEDYDDLIIDTKASVIKQSSAPAVISSITTKTTTSTSRYLTDFEELEFLGRGGFGSVVKVRNKIDDRFYAVKKIALDPRDVEYNKKILREVTTLSRLHHERIIRYYQAWIEDAIESEDEDKDEERSDDYSKEGSEGSEDNTTTITTTANYSAKRRQSKTIDLSLGPKSFKPFKGLIDEFDAGNSFDDIEEEEDNEEYDDFIQFESVQEDEAENSDSETTDSDITDTVTAANQTVNHTVTGSSSKSSRGQVLYIQMEYCPNQTLRDLIDERNSDPTGHFLDPPEIWRLFRQIVEGLVHIHAQGMMHRDLKPSNIFLDSNGDVKIGDFGLAVTRIESTITGRSDSPMHNLMKVGGVVDKSITGESHTQNIGTPFYVSPEQLGSASSSARYNQKVDMYSLGIILIELWVPFATGMERVQSLQKCRLPEIIFPAGLEEENVMKIGRRLLCHDPKKRFTSLELLRSDLLPPMLEEELMEDAMRSVAQPQAAHYPRLISTIFRRVGELDPGQIKAKDFAFDVHSGNPTELAVCEESGRIKKELIEKVFVRHGAIEINPPLLYLPVSSSELQAQTYSVLDDSGQKLELPGNLTRPFARWVAQSSLQLKGPLKRFTVDRVFRKISQVSGGQPYQPNEAAFDIVDNEDEKGYLGLCEVVRVAFDSIKLLLPGVKNETLTLKINHMKIYKKFGSLDEKMMKLLNPVKNDEPAEALIQRFKINLPDFKTIFDELLCVMKYLQKLAVVPGKVKIVFDPLMSGPRPELYENDLIFIITRETGKRGISEALCCGGRYNQLIEEYKFPIARLEGKGPFGVGVSIFLDNLTTPILKKTKPLAMILNLVNCDQPTNEELWLIGEIWRLGRGTNLMIPRGGVAPSGNSIQIQVKSNSGKVRVKNGREVEELTLEEFVVKLENNDFNENVMSDTPDPQDLDHPEDTSLLTTNDPITPVHYILSNPNAKSSDRSNPIMREKALKALKQLTTTIPKSVEILIHELPRDIIGKLLYEPGALVQSRKMGEEQRDQVQRMSQFLLGGGNKKSGNATVSHKLMVLFNHKDNQIDLYYINK